MFSSINASQKHQRGKRRNRSVDEPTTTPSLPLTITTRCPLEVIEVILDFLHNDPQTLSICGRVCKAWLTICRDHLFSEITLHQQNFDAFFDLLLYSPEFGAHVRSRASSMKMVQNTQNHQRWIQCCIPYMGCFAVTHLFIKGLRTSDQTVQTHLAISTLGTSFRPPTLETNFQSVTSLELAMPTFQTLAQFVGLICGLPSLERLSLVKIAFDKEAFPLKTLTCQEKLFPQKLRELRLWYHLPFHGSVIYHWLGGSVPALPPVRTFNLQIAAQCPGASVREDFWVAAGQILSKFGSLEHLTIASFGLSATDVLSHNGALLSLRFNNIDLRENSPTRIHGVDPHTTWQWVPELLDQVVSPYMQVVEFEILIDDVDELEILDWERVAQSLSRPQFSYLRSVHFIMSDLKKAAGRRIREKLPECTERGIVRLSQPALGVGYDRQGALYI